MKVYLHLPHALSILVLLSITSFSPVLAQNVGIGTLTPLTKLHVSFGPTGNTEPYGPLLVEGNNNTFINLMTPDGYESGILFGNAYDAASGGIVYSNGITPNGLQFRTNGNVTRMVIKNNGYVGIGLSTASALLSISSNGGELAGSSASNLFRIHAGTLGSVAGNELRLASIGFASGNNSSLGIRAHRMSAGADWTTASLLLEHDVDNSPKINGGYLALAANGNIGIGTPTPSAKLHVSSGNESFALFGPNVSGGKLYVGATIDQAVALTAQVLATDGNLHIDPAPGRNIYLGYYQPRDIFINPSGGKLGIGTTAPTASLEVNGFTKLGGEAPAIKYKKLTGTTASTQGGYVWIPHGLDKAKILSVSIIVFFGNNNMNMTGPSAVGTGENFHWFNVDGDIVIYNWLNDSINILSKLVKILIAYEE